MVAWLPVVVPMAGWGEGRDSDLGQAHNSIDDQGQGHSFVAFRGLERLDMNQDLYSR